jgi:hypothetical protein
MKPSRPVNSSRGVFALAAVCAIVSGCDSVIEEAPTDVQATLPSVSSIADRNGQSAGIVPAPAITQASWAPNTLEELLAPIALYPDQLVGQILAASVNSQEVLDAGNWLLEHQDLTGQALDAAAQQAGFGPAMRALVQFPSVVDMMCQELDWTRQLGSAFSSDQAAVLDAVQRLRAEAFNVGNLKSTPEQTVETKTENDKVVIEVKPADPQIVYVPQYNPQVVYTQPPPPPAPAQSTVSTSDARADAAVAFGAGILLAAALDDDDCCYPYWGSSVVFVGPRPFYPPAYVYRPVYGPAFRPSYHYAAPRDYRHNYNNNVVINHNDYYNRFSNDRNIHGTTQSPIADRETYSGPRNEAVAERLNAAAGGRAVSPTADQRPAAQRPLGDSAPTPRARDPAQTDAPARAAQADRSYHADRGYGTSTRTPSTDTSAARVDARAAPANDARAAPPNRTPPREQAFTGASTPGNGSFERSASTRGHASGASLQQRGGARGRR